MKQPLTLLSILLVMFLSGCVSSAPRLSSPMTWFKLPGSTKQDEEKLANKDGIDIQSKKTNPFKRNKKQNEEIALASMEKEGQRSSSKIDQLIDQELVDASETERAQMKQDLKGKDIVMVRSLLRVWKNVRRVQQNSPDDNDTQQAASDFPIRPASQSSDFKKNKPFKQQQDDKRQMEEQLLLASLEKERAKNSRLNDLPNRSGLGASNPWGDSPFGRTNKSPSRPFPQKIIYDSEIQ